jgi:hypothetical protein
MREPHLTQGLEATPAVMRAQGNGKDVAHLAIEVGEVALRVIDRTHRDIGQARETLRQEAQSNALAVNSRPYKAISVAA